VKVGFSLIRWKHQQDTLISANRILHANREEASNTDLNPEQYVLKPSTLSSFTNPTRLQKKLLNSSLDC